MREYSPHEDQTYLAMRDELLDAIQTVLLADRLAARKAHHVSPHLRLKDLNRIKNDDVSGYSVRRLVNIAAGLGIECEIRVKVPKDLVA